MKIKMEKIKPPQNRGDRLRSRGFPTVAPRVILDVGLMIAVVILISSPALLTRQPFMTDYANSLWLSWVQGHAIADGMVPSYFLHTTSQGVFNPFYAFYGGPLWSVFGATDAILGGHVVIAFVGVTAVAIAAAYGGTLWLARQCGVQGLLAHVPALVFPTSAYYVTNLYGRGSLAEFMATSAIPLLIASTYHLLRTPRWTPLPVLAFLGSLVIFTGSHNITLLWALVVSVFTTALLVAVARPKLPRFRRVAGVIGLSCLGLAVNAWYLLPNLLYASRTSIGAGFNQHPEGYHKTDFFNTPQILFHPLRSVPAQSTTPALYVQAPIWFLLWACGAGVVIWIRSPAKSLRRVWLGAAIVIAVLVTVIVSTPLWDVMPAPLTFIQFPYRLVTYVTLAIAGLVLIGCVALTRSRGAVARALRVSAVGVSLISVGLCAWQLWVPKTEPADSPAYYSVRQQVLTSVSALPSLSWYDRMSYADASTQIHPVGANRIVTIDPALIRRDRFSGWIAFPPGTAPVLTNIAGGPYLVRIEGVRRLGRDPSGFTVVQRLKPGSGPVHVVVETAASSTVRLGRLLSVAGLLGSLIVLVVLASESHERRRGGRQYSVA